VNANRIISAQQQMQRPKCIWTAKEQQHDNVQGKQWQKLMANQLQ